MALAEDSRLQVAQYADWCLGRFFGAGHAQVPVSCVQGILSEKLGVYVTFSQSGQALYAMGILLPDVPLHQSIGTVYQQAATVVQKEAGGVVASLKVISRPQPCKSIDNIDLQCHGIILFSRGRSHYLLPGFAPDKGLSRIGALEYLCRCLALPPGCWRDRTARILTFEAEDV